MSKILNIMTAIICVTLNSRVIPHNESEKYEEEDCENEEKIPVFDIGGNPFEFSNFRNFLPNLREEFFQLKSRFKLHAHQVLAQAKMEYVERMNISVRGKKIQF